MMQLLGFKRAVLLGVLFGVNLLIIASLFLFIMPMKEEADMRLTSAKSEISRLQSGIQNIKAELQSLKETMPQYDALSAKGFFLNQDRFYVSRTLEEMKGRSQLFGFSFVIDNIRDVPSTDATAANRRLVASRIQIDKVSSLFDTGFFDFMNIIETSFPAHVRIQSFQLKKPMKINEDILKRVSAGPTTLIDASITMDWLSMVEIPPLPVPSAGGF